MRTRLMIAISVLLVIAGVQLAEAELSEKYVAWADGPAGFLLTEDEAKEWRKITADADAKHFIELFWARRNPNPTQPFNEFKAQFDARVRYADEKFGYERTGDEPMRGALTDRAKVMILMGVPHNAEHRGPTETVQSVGTAAGQTGMGSDEVRSNVVMWSYDPTRLSGGYGVRGSRLLFVFYEDRTGSNNFVLDRSHQEATMALRALARAPQVHLLHPELEQVARPVSVPNGEPAAVEQLACFDAAAPALTEEARFIVEPGVADASHQPLWFHVALPAEAPVLDSLAGRVLDEDGEILSTFQTAAVALAAGDHRAYHLTFPVADGTYRVEVVGVADGQPQFVYSEIHEVPGMPIEGSWMSPLWAGLEATRDDSAPLGAPFTFGAWHLIPLPDGPISKSNELSYFGFVVRPGLGEDGEPALKAKIVLKQDGKRLGSPLRIPLAAVKVAEDLYLYANALQLAPFPAPATYELEFSVEDSVSGAEIEKVVVLDLVE